jgi:hypothetical protein
LVHAARRAIFEGGCRRRRQDVELVGPPAREARDMVLFPIRRDPLWRAPLLVILATESRSKVTLHEDAMDVTFGVASVRIPYSNIRDVRERSWSFLLGIGIRIAGDKTLGLIGSTQGVVQIALHEPTVRGVLFMRHPQNVAVSLEDPQAFIQEIERRLAR